MSSSISIRSLLLDSPKTDQNPTLREIAKTNLELEFNRTPEGDIVQAMLPGDDINKHPRYFPNKYMRESYSVVKVLVKSGTLPPEEQKLALEALYYMSPPPTFSRSQG